MRLSRTLVLAAALSLGAIPVQAQTTLFSGTYTGGSNFNTTASISLTYDAVSSGVYVFSLDVTNLGNYDAVFRAIGLFNLPAYTLVSATSNLTGWHLPPPQDFSGDGLTPQTVDLIAPDPSPHLGLQVGQSGSFQFQIAGLHQSQPGDQRRRRDPRHQRTQRLLDQTGRSERLRRAYGTAARRLQLRGPGARRPWSSCSPGSSDCWDLRT